jgi:uncharacterized tellurite resistance protein B-like protein
MSRATMLDRLIAFLKDLPFDRDARKVPADDDPRVAAAALLYHVMNADGVRQDTEWDRVKSSLSEAYGVTGKELDDLVKAGAEADNEAIDLYAFTSVLNRHLDEEGKLAFIRLMWDVVYADGTLHELEDNTLWRVAELIGVDARDRVMARRAAAQDSGAADDAAGE